MVVSVVRNYHWTPDVIGGLFFDAEDYEGLEYWMNDIEAQIKQLKEKK